MRSKLSFQQRLDAEEIDHELVVIFLRDQLEALVPQIAEREQHLNLGYFERHVRGQIVWPQIGDTVMIVALDVDLQIRRDAVLVEQVAKRTAAHVGVS